MFLTIATDLIFAGICCTVPLMLIISASKICGSALGKLFKSCAHIAWILFLTVYAGLSTLLQDLFAWAMDISPLITIPICYYPDSIFSALHTAGTDWFRAFAVAWAVGTGVTAAIMWLSRRKGRDADGCFASAEGIMLAVLNWYNPIYWWFARCVSCKGDATVPENSSVVAPEDCCKRRIWRNVILIVTGVAVLASASLLFDFKLVFREQTDVLGLFGAPEEGVAKSDFVKPMVSESFGTPYFSVDSRYSGGDYIDFFIWHYEKEIPEDDIYAWMQPLEERLTQAFGGPEAAPRGMGIFSRRAETALRWTAVDDAGKEREIVLYYIPGGAYYSDALNGGMAVELWLR